MPSWLFQCLNISEWADLKVVFLHHLSSIIFEYSGLRVILFPTSSTTRRSTHLSPAARLMIYIFNVIIKGVEYRRLCNSHCADKPLWVKTQGQKRAFLPGLQLSQRWSMTNRTWVMQDRIAVPDGMK